MTRADGGPFVNMMRDSVAMGRGPCQAFRVPAESCEHLPGLQTSDIVSKPLANTAAAIAGLPAEPDRRAQGELVGHVAEHELIAIRSAILAPGSSCCRSVGGREGSCQRDRLARAPRSAACGGSRGEKLPAQHHHPPVVGDVWHGERRGGMTGKIRQHAFSEGGDFRDVRASPGSGPPWCRSIVRGSDQLEWRVGGGGQRRNRSWEVVKGRASVGGGARAPCASRAVAAEGSMA